MNGIERHLGVFNRHLKNIKLTFTTISVGVLLAISSVAMVANAQEEDLMPEPVSVVPIRAELTEQHQANRVEAQERIEEKKEEFVEITETRRTALSERAQERVTNLAANISNRMEGAVARIRNIADRFQTRIDKMEVEGLDVTHAQEHLDDAYAALNSASGLLSDIDNQVAEVTGSEKPKASWTRARAIYDAAKTDIKAAHTSLRMTLTALKDATVENNTEKTDEEAGNTEDSEPTEDDENWPSDELFESE